MKEIVLASSNAGKLREFDALFSDHGFTITPQSMHKVEDAIEDGLSFVENALIKARHASRQSGLPAIADDSGLEVDALKGEPGIYSARYSRDIVGDNANDKTNNQKLLEKMAAVPDERRTARFVCALAVLRHENDPRPLISIGAWEGVILRAERGENGFGYDPLFFVPDQQCSSAELPPELKNSISHRAQALAQLLPQLELLS